MDKVKLLELLLVYEAECDDGTGRDKAVSRVADMVLYDITQNTQPERKRGGWDVKQLANPRGFRADWNEYMCENVYV